MKWPLKLLLSPMLLIGTWITAQNPMFPEPLSPRIANYRIAVSLDTDTSRIKGQEMLLWYNKTENPVSDLRFHLYLNGFRNDESSFMTESNGSHRGNQINSNGYGFTELSSIKVLPVSGDLTSLQFGDASTHPQPDSMTEKLSEMGFLAPDDNNEADKTYFRIPLEAPVEPGQAVWVYVTWEAQLPTPPFARTGSLEEFFFIGQWFPKIAVLKEDGQWTNHQFHVNTEFFADYGVYDVFMTVPENYVLGATGLEVEVKPGGPGQKVHYYHAEDVHDFAWTCSPEYVEGRVKSQDVEIRVLCQKEHESQMQRMLDAAAFSVAYFQDWYGDYPFPNLTVVDPRRGAGGAGGMEYPTLITAGTSYGMPMGFRPLEIVTLHEFGHNYWYHLLASNEWEESWMDEGINSYTESKIMQAKYGSGDFMNIMGVKINIAEVHRMGYQQEANRDPTMLPGWRYYSNGSYSTNSYSKPAVLLLTLDNYLGEDLMRKVMQEYVKEWSFRHPKSQDFVDVVNRVTGKDFNGYFEQALYTRKELDYGVSSIKTQRSKPTKGFDHSMSLDQIRTLEERRAEQNKDDDEDEKDGTKIYHSTVKVLRYGEFIFPVEVEFAFEGGEKIRETWDGKDLWKRFDFYRDKKIVSATVDPDNKLVLDINMVNNSQTIDAQNEPIVTLASTWMVRLQAIMEFLSL